jgi:ferredoxin
LGGDTSVVCLECEDLGSIDRIPADREEVRGAWEEGLKVIYSRGVRTIYGAGERVTGIECPKCTNVWGETGFDPKFDISDTIKLDADVLIITVGQGPDRLAMEKGELCDERGRLVFDPDTLQSLKKDWVFVGGDMRKIGFLVTAMKDGLVAAESIERYLTGMDMKRGRKLNYETQDIPLRREYEPEPEVVWIPPEKRMHFHLFENGFTLLEAIEEGRRCATCGPCVSCKACVSVGIQESLPTVEVNQERCSGCGFCVSACLYDSAQLKQIEGKPKSITDAFKCKSCGMCVVACPSGVRTLVGDGMETRIKEVYATL